MTGIWVSVALGLLGALTGIAFSMGRIVTAVVMPEVSLASGLLGLLVSIVAAAVSVNVARAERSAALTLAACGALGMLALPEAFALPAVLMLLPGVWMPVRMWLTARRSHADDSGRGDRRARGKGDSLDDAPPELDDAAFSGRFIPSPELIKPEERYDPIDDIAVDDSVFDPEAPLPTISPDNPFDSVALLANDDSLFAPDDGVPVDFDSAARYEADYAELLEAAPAVESIPAPVITPEADSESEDKADDAQPTEIAPATEPVPESSTDSEADGAQPTEIALATEPVPESSTDNEADNEADDAQPTETALATDIVPAQPSAKYRPYNKKKRDRSRVSKR